MKKIFLVGVALLTMATVPMVLGSLLRPGKLVTVPTCDSDAQGAMFIKNGGDGQSTQAMCVCVGDGAATAAYQWCSLAFAVGDADLAMTCTGGSSTVCP